MQEKFNWNSLNHHLLEHGFVKTEPLLSPMQCQSLIDGYDDDIYRSTIDMQRYNFGRGQYKYFHYPHPPLIGKLREYFYSNLLITAREWAQRLKIDQNLPDHHQDYLKLCQTHQQHRPTPLILKYGPEDYNCLHQDLYGPIHFPYQAAIMLSDQKEYKGGEFTLVEQRPRQQSVAHVQTLKQGQAIIFAVNEFPKQGKKGYYRAKLRHGVSKITRGNRHTLGIILHDAK